MNKELKEILLFPFLLIKGIVEDIINDIKEVFKK